MDTVWIVGQGTYSDYREVAAFSTERRAREFAALLEKGDTGYGGETHVFSMEIDPPDPVWKGFIDRGLSLFFLEINMETGNVSEARKRSLFYGDDEPDDLLPRVVEIPMKPGWVGVTCWARDEDHAVKIAGDARRVALAGERRAS